MENWPYLHVFGACIREFHNPKMPQIGDTNDSNEGAKRRSHDVSVPYACWARAYQSINWTEQDKLV